jgi:hypothetical protein
MGAQSFTVRSRGRSAEEAYRRAVEDANDEYGHQQGYSGAINATPGFTDATKKYMSSGLPKYNFIEKRLEELTKHQGAECICIREPKLNTNKIKTQVDHVVTPGTKKWILKYVAYSYEGEIIASCTTKGEAVKKARDYTEKHQRTTNIVMEKCLEKGNKLVAKITYKKSSNEQEGEWEFYGWASC